MKGAESAVVIGGGVLGLEAAWELRRGGLNVTVAGGRPRPDGPPSWTRMPPPSCGISARKQRPSPSAPEPRSPPLRGRRRSPACAWRTGETFPADLVIVSAGVRANVAVAKEMGLEVDRAVVVNERMETNLQDVYACGDCAQYQGMNYAIWLLRLWRRARWPAPVPRGTTVTYTPVSAALTFHGMDNRPLFAAGGQRKESQSAL